MQLRIPKTPAGSWLSIFISVCTVLIHSGCCLLPLLAAAFPTSVFAQLFPESFGRWLVIFPYTVLAYLLVRMLLDQLGAKRFHNALERVGFIVAIFLAAGGLAFGHRKTEVQQLTEARLAMIVQNGQMSFRLDDCHEYPELYEDLVKLDGVLDSSVELQDNEVRLSYRRSKITKAQIFSYLVSVGYQIRATE